MAKPEKYVYLFGNKKADGNGSMKPLLGGKGANLAEMSRIGLPVPPGFTITTEVCTYYYANKKTYPKALRAGGKGRRASHREDHGHQVRRQECHAAAGLRPLRRARLHARHDGHHPQPRPQRPDRPRPGQQPRRTSASPGIATAVSCRCTATSSWASRSARTRITNHLKSSFTATSTRSITATSRTPKLTADDQQELVIRFKALIKERTGKEFPQDPWKQLWGAVGAVFGSWMNDRAIVYRRKYNIPSEWGTAVNVQAMVYGNTGDNVRLRRGVHPQPGQRRRRSSTANSSSTRRARTSWPACARPNRCSQLKNQMPDAYKELNNIRATLEQHFKDVQDFEFTIQDGKVFMLQTRNGKRTAMAALKFSMDMVEEKLIDWKTAIRRNPADQLDQLLAPDLRAAEGREGRQGHCQGPARRSRRGLRQESISTPSARSRSRAQRARKCCSSATRPRPKTCAA